MIIFKYNLLFIIDMTTDPYSKQRDDYKLNSYSDSKFENKLYDLISRFSKVIGIKIPKKYYPEIRITQLINSGYDDRSNTIYISENNRDSGITIGEEIGHFIRDYSLMRSLESKKGFFQRIFKGKYNKNTSLLPLEFTNNFEDRYTGEFFGYLGRKILERVSKPNDGLNFTPGANPYELKSIVPKIKKANKRLRELLTAYKNKEYPEGKTKEDIEQRIIGLRSFKFDVQQHQRPYYFASRIDLDKLNLKELYLLEDKEVRYRFFREDPQYNVKGNGSDPNKRNLEGKLLSIIGLILGLFFLSNNITGRVISNFNNQNYKILGVIIFIASIIGLYFSFNKSR